MSGCKCTSSGVPLGQSAGDVVLKAAKKILFKERLNSDGSVASLDLSGNVGTYDAEWWAGYLQAPNMRDRYFVTPYIDDVTPETQDAEYLETSNKVEFEITPNYIQWTMKVFGSEGVGASTDLMRRFERLKCLNLGILIIDDCDHLAGEIVGDEMRLVPIDSLRVVPRPAVKGESIAHIEVSFRIGTNYKWSSLDVFMPNEEEGDLSLSELYPVVPLIAVNIGVTPSSPLVDLTLYQSTSAYASGQNQVGTPHLSLQASNITAISNTIQNDVVSLVNNMDGTYQVTLTTPLVNDEPLVLSVNQPGFELAPVTVIV